MGRVARAPSLDLRLGGRGGHCLDLFQELHGKVVLDARIWFADLAVLGSDGSPLGVDAFIAGGMRWWQAMYAGERVRPGAEHPGHGIRATAAARIRGLFRRTAR